MILRRLSAVLCALWGAGLGTAVSAALGASEPDHAAFRPVTIHSGIVIINGRYIPRPYTVSRKADGTYVNDLLVYELPKSRSTGSDEATNDAAESRPHFPGPDRTAGFRRANTAGPGSLGYPRPRRAFWGPPPQPVTSRLAQQLAAYAVVIRWADGTTRCIWQPRGFDLIELLLSKQDRSEKLDALASLVDDADDPHWAELVGSFVASEEIIEQIGPIIEERRRAQEENEQSIRGWVLGSSLSSNAVLYAINVGGMFLVVVSFGTVLSYRPRRGMRWSQLDRTGRGCSTVFRHVGLILVLSGFDLVCTLLAQQAGSFWELNPLGTHLGANAASLMGFKFTAVAGSCTILVLLRRYYGAQVASWWMCLLCTILMLRWTTYNAMFLV